MPYKGNHEYESLLHELSRAIDDEASVKRVERVLESKLKFEHPARQIVDRLHRSAKIRVQRLIEQIKMVERD